MPSRPATSRLTTLATLALLATAGCRDGDPVAPPIAGLGTLEGRWDGAAWRGYGYAVLDGDTLYLVGHRPDPRHFYDERVRVTVPFHGVGTYVVGPSHARLEQITGGDAGWFPGAAGELRVTGYDAGDARIRGTLALTAAEHGFAWRFEDGSFDAPVYARWQDVPRVRR